MRLIGVLCLAVLAVAAQAQTVTSVTCSPSTVVGGSHSELIVHLSGAAGSAVTVSLSSNSPAATLPTTMTVNAGSDYGTLIFATSGADASTVATLTATLGSSEAAGAVTVNPPSLSSIEIAPNPITGGNTTAAYAYLNGQAGPSGITVSLTSSNSAVAATPASLTVAPGAVNGMASVTSAGVDSSTNVTITGTVGGASESSILQVLPAVLRSVVPSQKTLIGGFGGINLYVYLNGQAGPSGVAVQLSSNSPGAASVPASMTVAAGTTGGLAAITTSAVGVNVPVTLTGQVGSSAPAAAMLLVESPIGSPWPVVGANVCQTGVGLGAGAAGTKAWTYSPQGSYGSYGAGQPVIGTGGDIYFSSEGGITALSPSGALLWQSPFGSNSAQLAVGGDGTVYCTTEGGTLMAFNSKGQQKWGIVGQNSSQIFATAPSIGLDGTIYVGTFTYSNGPSITALNPDKTIKWTRSLSSSGPEPPQESTPSVGPDGTIYIPYFIGGNSWNLVALTPAGTVKWSLQLALVTAADPVVGADGTLYLTGNTGSHNIIYAISATGSVKWTYEPPAGGNSLSLSAALGADGTVYFATGFSFCALTANGTLKWTYDAQVGFGSHSLAVDSSGAIYGVGDVFGGDAYLFAVNPDGSTKWRLYLDTDQMYGPIIGADGSIYMYTFFAYDTGSVFYAIH